MRTASLLLRQGVLGMAKKVLVWLGKVLAAGITAFVILTLFCVFYYNPPIHVPSGNGATGYTREAGVFWSRATEGFANGKTDEAGYNNSYPAAKDTIDILMMGSSQTEGLYVNEDACASYLLNERFAGDGSDYYVYNIGMSAHTFYRNVSNLEAALAAYSPKEYVAVETSNLVCIPEEVEPSLLHTMPELTLEERSPLLKNLQRIPYLKLLYQQYQSGRMQEDTAAAASDSELFDEWSLNATRQILSYIEDTAEAAGCHALIYYIPPMVLGGDGTLQFQADDVTRETYAKLCKEEGILFVDMTERIQEAYETEYVLASGFDNTTIGYGHLNEYGHEILADAIYDALAEEEGR